jgi:hypothetical protein
MHYTIFGLWFEWERSREHQKARPDPVHFSPMMGEGQGEGCLNFVLQFFLNSDILNSEKYMEVHCANRKIRHSRN